MKARRILGSIIVFAVTMTAINITLAFLFPFHGVNDTEWRLNLTTGQIEKIRYVYWLNISTETVESPLSKALYTEGTGDGGGAAAAESLVLLRETLIPSSHRTNLNSGALYQMNMLELLWEKYDFSIDEKAAHAGKLINIWSRCGQGGFIRSDDCLKEIRRSKEREERIGSTRE